MTEFGRPDRFAGEEPSMSPGLACALVAEDLLFRLQEIDPDVMRRAFGAAARVDSGAAALLGRWAERLVSEATDKPGDSRPLGAGVEVVKPQEGVL